MYMHLLTLCLVLAHDRPAQVQAKADLKNAPQLALEAGDINGYYICKGAEVGGKTYAGVTVITRKNDVYVVQWVIGSGSNFTGIGIRQGNTLAVSWAIPGERGVVRGVNVYRIEVTSTGPRLVGRWASMPGPGALQSETLTFLKSSDAEE